MIAFKVDCLAQHTTQNLLFELWFTTTNRNSA